MCLCSYYSILDCSNSPSKRASLSRDLSNAPNFSKAISIVEEDKSVYSNPPSSFSVSISNLTFLIIFLEPEGRDKTSSVISTRPPILNWLQYRHPQHDNYEYQWRDYYLTG